MKTAVVSLTLAIVLVLAGLMIWINVEQPQMLRNPVFDTGEVMVSVGPNEPAILVFSKTNGFRHKNAIAEASRYFEELGERRGWSVVTTENGAVFAPENLASFDLLVWNNASGPLLTIEQQIAVQDFVENGGGFVGIHSAGDGSHGDWEWYQLEIIRTEFIGHPVFPLTRTAALRVESPQHPVLEGLPASWSHTDEWYSFAASPRDRGVNVLLTVDEADYTPARSLTGRNLSMGSDHPVLWSHRVGTGCVVYMAMGHGGEVFRDDRIQRILEQAIQWVGKMQHE